MYKDTKLVEASLSQILEELENRSMDYHKCFIGEALLLEKVTNTDDPIRKKLIADDQRATGRASATVRMIDWIQEGKELLSESVNDVRNAKREKHTE